MIPLSQYRNITISGLPGSGSTTLLNALREHPTLKFESWRGFNGGEYMRDYAIHKGLIDGEGKLHHDATTYSEDFDREVDMSMRGRLQSEDHWILESWLSGFFSQGVDGVLKILMMCSNTAVRVDRIVNRDQVTAEEALENMNKRYRNNSLKWRKMYKQEWHDWLIAKDLFDESDPIDFWHPDLYDIVIDTYSTNRVEAVDLVINAISSQNAP